MKISHRLSISKILLSGICLLLFWNFLPNEAEGQIPRWYLDGRSAEYPSPAYITGVGEGQNPEDAAGQARASVTAQIRVQIESEITSITREMSVDDQSTFETMFTSATTSRVDETLQGLDIALQAEHAGMFYALAALNRQRFLNELRSDLDRLKEEFNTLTQSGRNQIREGNIFAGISNLLDTQNLSSDFYGAMSMYNALSDTPYDRGDVLGMSSLVSEIRDALTSIRITVVSGDDQTASSGRPLPEPLVIQAVYSKDGRDSPIPNLPLRIEYQDGSEADRLSTESNGKASFYLTALPVRSEVNQVTIRPVFTAIPGNYRDVIRNMSLRATYRIAQDEQAVVAVVIRDEDGARLSRVEQRVGSAVERLGYTINDRAAIVIEGTLSLMDVREVDGIAGTQTAARTELSLMVKNRRDNSVIGSLSAEGTGMSPRGEAEALRASQNRININRRELSEVMSSVPADAGLVEEPIAERPAPGREAAKDSATLSSITIDNLSFEVRKAEMTADNRVIITVQVTNLDYRDQDINFRSSNTVMFDNQGNENSRPILTIGTNRQGSGSVLRHLLISNLPVTLTLEFREVNPRAENIALLSIRAGGTTAQLRNIPLSK